MIAATTPLEHKVWQALGRLSSRWIFFRLKEATTEGFDLRDDFAAKKAACAEVVQRFIKGNWLGFADYPWNRTKDNEYFTDCLKESAERICKWRGISVKQDGAGFNPNLVEVPYRLAETLYALARGHAILWEREQIEYEDTVFAVDVNDGNMPEDRARLYEAFGTMAHKNLRQALAERQEEKPSLEELAKALRKTISLRQAARTMGCSTEKATNVLQEMTGLGIIEQVKEENGGDASYRWVL
jgi:hypothetical protein